MLSANLCMNPRRSRKTGNNTRLRPFLLHLVPFPPSRRTRNTRVISKPLHYITPEEVDRLETTHVCALFSCILSIFHLQKGNERQKYYYAKCRVICLAHSLRYSGCPIRPTCWTERGQVTWPIPDENYLPTQPLAAISS